jgi:hypothetical protein
VSQPNTGKLGNDKKKLYLQMITYMMTPKRKEKNYKTIIIIFTDPGMKSITI